MARSALAMATAALVIAGLAPSRALLGQGYDYQREAAFTRDLLTALENGNTADAERLMRDSRTANAAGDVVKTLPDPNSKAARTAYDVRKKTAEAVMAETARRMHADPKTRGRLISIEIGGTAGKEGPGFTPKTADLDFQLRGADPEASRIARDIAMQVLGEMNVPDSFKINPFAANPDDSPFARNQADLNAGQLERLETAQRRRIDTQASKGDANDAVRADYFERGMAYEVDPATGEIRTDPETGRPRGKPVDQLYQERGWEPPTVTDASAFGTAANERQQFATLSEDAKRVFRAADALATVDPAALTPAERATVDLSRRIYQTRDPARAIQALPKNHPVRAAYEADLKRGLAPADAVRETLAREDARARGIFDKAMERTLDAKLQDIDRTIAMTDHDVLLEVGDRTRRGDEGAADWLADYRDASAAEKAEMLKMARERMVNDKRIGLVETFAYLSTDVRERITSIARFAENEFIRNASALADVMSGRHEGLNHGREALSDALDAAEAGKAKAKADLPETSAEYHPGYPGGGFVRAADRALIAVALTGALDDIVSATLEAYDKGGKGAAAVVFVQRTAATGKDVMVGMAVQFIAEQAGLYLERRRLLPVGFTAGANALLTVQALVEVSKVIGGVIWRSAQDPFLRTSLDTGAAVSFYQVMGVRPLTLSADIRLWAKNNRKLLLNRRVDPNDLRAVLRQMIRDYAGDSGVKASWMSGMDARLFDALWAQADRSDDFLTALTASLNQTSRRADAVAAEQAKEAERAQAEAAEAARKARELRRERDAAAREKAAADQAARERAARDEAQTGGSAAKATPSDAQERWDTLRQQKLAEDEARRRQEAELQRQQAAEAADRRAREAEERRRAEEESWREAEERRRLEIEAERRAAEEAALFEDATIDIIVPTALQPGQQASIGVAVRAPSGLRLAGRRVAIRASPGHTDDGSIPLDGSGRGRTNYVAPADYNGYVRVTVSIEGQAQVSRTFLVGKPVAEAPPERKIENPKEVTLPETKDTPPPAPPPPPPAPVEGPCAVNQATKRPMSVANLRLYWDTRGERARGGSVSLDAMLAPAALSPACLAGCPALEKATRPTDAELQACIGGR